MAGTNDRTQFQLIEEDTGTGSLGTQYWTPKQHNRREGVFQVWISAAATVQLLGRKNSSFNWAVLGSFTESGAVEVSLMPQMSIQWTGNTDLFSAGIVD